MDSVSQFALGAGIGLVITKNLVEEMGGEIGFSSEIGVGSAFWVEFPASATAPEATMIMDQVPAAADAMLGKIVYIEDNPVNLSLMEAIIARLNGVQMFSAHTAELGLDMAMAEKPDLIIMDINLPGMDGLEAIRTIKRTAGIDQIPVIAISAKTTKNHIEAGLHAGFLDYFTTPIDISKLIGSIESALAQGTAMAGMSKLGAI